MSAERTEGKKLITEMHASAGCFLTAASTLVMECSVKRLIYARDKEPGQLEWCESDAANMIQAI